MESIVATTTSARTKSDKSFMPEYTDLYCNSPETAKAVESYLHEQLYSEEESERPDVTAIIVKSTLRITYGDGVSNTERREWDMVLMGYRDGYDEGRRCAHAELVQR